MSFTANMTSSCIGYNMLDAIQSPQNRIQISKQTTHNRTKHIYMKTEGSKHIMQNILANNYKDPRLITGSKDPQFMPH